MKIVPKLKFLIPAFALTLLACAIVIYPERYVSCCFQGFIMWAECVLPSLFPFMVIALIAVKSGFAEKASLPLKKITGLFGLPPAGAVCLVISIFSGYPAGARILTEFYDSGCVSSSDCKKLSVICSTSGPLFILGSVGIKMLGDKSAGWFILLAHMLSVIVTGLLTALFTKKKSGAEYMRKPKDENLLYNCFYSGVVAVAVAGGFIAFFFVTAQVMYDFNVFLPLEKFLSLFTDENTASALCFGLVEATCGCRQLAQNGGNFTVPFAGFLITFGGISIILQQLSYLIKAKVNPAYFITVKFIQGIICFLLLLLFTL